MGGPARTAFVGRAEEMAAVRSAIDDGGCVIAGAAGIGKSRLAAEAARNRPAIRVLATHSAATVPYGAFAHLLPTSSRGTTDVIPDFIQMLRARPQPGQVVLVDDGHLLDDASAALVLALATSGAARPVVTVRTGEPVPDAIAALWKERGLERIDVQSLSAREVGELVRLELAGEVHPRAVARIADLSMGNPLYVRELIHDARQTGALEQAAEGWRWREDLLAFDRLSVLIERRTGTVGAVERRALAVVALVERIPLDVLFALTSEEAVEELERAGLVRVATSMAAEVTVAHPLYGEVVAAGLPRTTAIRIRREAAAALRTAGADPLRIAALLLDSGAPESELYLEASRLALARGGVPFALRLARAADPGFDSALAAAAALVNLARFDEVEDLLAPYEQEAVTAPLEVSVEYVWTRSRALLRGSGPDTGRARLLERARSWHTGPEWDALLAAEDGWSALYDGRPEDALGHVEKFLDDERVSAARRFFMCVIAMNVYYRLARFDGVLAARDLIEDLVGAMAVPPPEVGVIFMRGKAFSAIHAGRDLHGTEASLLATRAESVAAGDRPLRTAATLLLGELALQRGHGADAVAYFDEAADALGEADSLNETLYVATLQAVASALTGDATRAEARLAEMERLVQLHPRKARQHTTEIESARAIVDGCAGRTSLAATRFLAAADAGHNHTAAEITALYEALRHGADPRIVGRGLRRRLVGAEHELGVLYAEHADALAMDDAAGQMSVARRFHERGCDLFAAEAAARAARVFAESGRAALAREAASLASRYAAPCGPVFSWALQLRPEAPALTGREREIAALAARGRTNKQIADDLFLSVRTVESHLLNACQKLGVANRRSLVDVLS